MKPSLSTDPVTVLRREVNFQLITLGRDLGIADWQGAGFFKVVTEQSLTSKRWGTYRVYLKYIHPEIFFNMRGQPEPVTARFITVIKLFETVAEPTGLARRLASKRGSDFDSGNYWLKRALQDLDTVSNFLVRYAAHFDEAVAATQRVLLQPRGIDSITIEQLTAAYTGPQLVEPFPEPLPPRCLAPSQKPTSTPSMNTSKTAALALIDDALQRIVKANGVAHLQIKDVHLLSDNTIQLDLTLHQLDTGAQTRTFRFAHINVMIEFMSRLSLLRARLATAQRSVPADRALQLILDIDHNAIIIDSSALDAAEREIARLERSAWSHNDDDEPPTGTVGITTGVRAQLSTDARNTVLRTIVAAALPELGAAVSETASEAWTNLTRFFDTMLPVAEEGLTPEGFKVSIPEREDFLNLQRSNPETTKAGVSASTTTGVTKSATLAGEMSKAGIGGALFASLNTIMIYSGVDEKTRYRYLGGAGLTMLAVGLRTDPVHTVAALVYAIPGTIFGAGAGHVTAEVLPVSDEAKTSIREAVPMLGGAASAGYGLYKTARVLTTIAKTCAGVDGAVVAYPLFLVGASTHKFVAEDIPAMVAAHDDYATRKNEYRAENDPFGDGEFIPDDDHGGEDGGVTADGDAHGDDGAGNESVVEAVALVD